MDTAVSMLVGSHGKGQNTDSAEGVSILLVDADPYLAFLIQLDLPGAHVVEASPDSTFDEMFATSPALVIIDIESSLISEVLGRSGASKVLGIADASVAKRTTDLSLDGLILRPFNPSELRRTVRRAIGMADSSHAPEGSKLARIHKWLGPARVAAVALAAVLQAAKPNSPGASLILAVAFAYAAIRLLPRGSQSRGAWMDSIFAAGILAASGGPDSDFLIFGLVAAAGAGLVLGMRAGALSGVLMVAASTASIISGLAGNFFEAGQVIAWAVLFPLSAIAGGFAETIWRDDARGGTGLLEEANRVLSTLYRIARAMPGGLDVGGVAVATLDEIRETLHSRGAVVLVGDGGLLTVAGCYGVPKGHDLLVDRDSPHIAQLFKAGVKTVQRFELPPGIAQALEGHDSWYVAPLLREGSGLGLVLASSNGEGADKANLLFMKQLSEDTSVALENATLFSSVRDLSVDEERRRLARELHDGVAQSLTHVRFELEFLSRHGAPAGSSFEEEAERLGRVADRTLSDVRAMILGLNSTISTEGLTGSLRSYLRDIKSVDGPDIKFQAKGTVKLLPEVEAEIFRIAQEAVSNAIRHSRGTRVSVLLENLDEHVVLAVEDDGQGIGDGKPNGTGGVGLKAMAERASHIGAALAISEILTGGTRVELKLAHN